MIVYIPSNGRAGHLKTGYRQPKISDLRKSNDFSSIDSIKKNEFVSLLLEDSTILPKLTIFDRDYLFTLGVASLKSNVFDFTSSCSECSSRIKDKLDLAEIEPIFLESPLDAEKVIFGKPYKFHCLLVEDEQEIIDYAIQDDSQFDERKEDATVCKILSKPITEENIQWVKELDVTVYYLALMYLCVVFHGITLQKNLPCPKCGAPQKVMIKITSDLLNIDLATILDRYVAISGKLDYQSFLEFTLPEYNTLVKSFNERK